MTNVKGKWAFITGASRGIGRLIAEAMAKEGANLVLHSRDIAHTVGILELVKKLGVEAYAVAADLGDLNSVAKMLAQIDTNGTQVDIVFNNAGLQVGYRADYLKTPIEDFALSFTVNTIAPAMITYHFLPSMIARKFGRVINTTSGIADQPEQAGYSASKAALDKFTIDIGRDLQGTDIVISLADPGWCSTDLGGGQAPNAPETSIPGILVGAFVDDGISGRLFGAQDFTGLSLEKAVEKAQKTL